MGDRPGVNDWLFARWYPLVAGVAERAGQRETRRELVGAATGRSLELGAGSGYNLAHYSAAVTELVVTEPSPHMLGVLRRQLRCTPPAVQAWDLVQTGAERLPFDDASFDTVVATYVHCTIPEPRDALAEIARVLRPGGRYLFLEHVRAERGSRLGMFQDLITRPHRYVAGGCHPNRDTAAALRHSPLRVDRLEYGIQPRSFPSVRPTIVGSATRS